MTNDKKETLEILEKGNIYFVYKPKEDQEKVKNIGQVQRFFMILENHDKCIFRSIIFTLK